MRARSSPSPSRISATSGPTTRTSSPVAPPAAASCCARTSRPPPTGGRRASLDRWLKERNLIGIAGVDTRRLVSRIRDRGAPKGCLAFAPDGRYDLAHLQSAAAQWPGLEGMDLTGEVSCVEPYEWTETPWSIEDGYGQAASPRIATSSAWTTASSTTSCAALPVSAAASPSSRHAARPRRSSPCGPTGSFFPTVPAIRRRPASSRSR